MKFDGKTSIHKINKELSSSRSYSGFMIRNLVAMGLLKENIKERYEKFELTSKGKQLSEILKSLPEVDNTWHHVPFQEYVKTL